jgi:hypothetical protein
MSIYKPTWLYIKQHTKTGLKYFGKTTRADPTKYLGSGTYWKNHLKIHGHEIITVWCELFYDKDLLVEEATAFSRSHDITNSDNWANLTPEHGLSGAMIGNIPHNKGKKMSNAYKEKLALAMIKVRSNSDWLENNRTKQKLAWQDPIKRENRLKNRKPHSDEIKKIQSAESTKSNIRTWADPLIRAKRIAGIKRAAAVKKAAKLQRP